MSLVMNIELSEPNIKEICRYMGCVEVDEVIRLIAEAKMLLDGKLLGRVCYSEYNICIGNENIDLGFARVKSNSLRRNLEGCNRIIIFAATIGLEVDRLILKYSKIKPSLAVCIQAFGAQSVEALCDAFEDKIKAENAWIRLKPRFSPGYGDLDITLQTEIFKALDCYKKIGITLNENMLISPTKSVTALIGIQQ